MIKIILLSVSLALVLIMGVDLVYTRIGIPLTLLGLSVFLFAIASYRESRSPSIILLLCVMGIAGYFLARGYGVGPLAFFVSDGVLILCAASTFLIGQMISQRNMIVLIGALIVLGFGNVLWGFAENSFAGSTGNSPITGMFGHYNVFVAFTNVIFYGALSFALLGLRALRWRVFFGVIAALCLVAIFSAGSRGGWIAFLVGGGVFSSLYLVHLNRINSRWFGPMLIALIVVIVGGGVTVKSKLDNIKEGRSGAGASGLADDGRVVFQQWGINFFLKEPIVGNGPRSFEYLTIKNWKLDELPRHFPDPDFVHNEFIQLLCDYGIIGFMMIIAVLFVCGVKGVSSFLLQSEHEEESKRLLMIFGLASITCLLAQSLFSFLFHFPALIALLGLIFSILYGMRPKPKRALFPSILAGCIGGIVMICGGVLSAAFYYYNESQELFENEARGNHHLVDARIRAAALAFDSEMAENVGVKAHEFSLRSLKEGDVITAKSFQIQALESFRLARRLNTHSITALCSTARILDEMGKHEEAYPLHLEAVKAAKFREFFLKPCVYAARNRINLALVAFKEGRLENAKTLFKEAQEFLEIRKKIIGSHDPGEDGSRFYASLKAWLTYFEAQRLYKAGDNLWKKRKAEKGMALMLEAEKRYLAARKVVEPHDPLSAIQLKQLQKNLTILKGAAITPVEISPEEIERISKGLKGLDTPAEKR